MSDQEKPKNPDPPEGTDGTRKGRTLTRADFLRIAGAAGVATAVGVEAEPAWGAPPAQLDTPTITCIAETQHTIFLQVCAGPSGAAAGFSLHWFKHSDYPSIACGGHTFPPTDDCDPNATPNNCNVCSGSFSGVPACSIYKLGPNQCITVEIGNLDDSVCGVSLHNCGANELECGQEYVFRVFAHKVPGGLNASEKSANLCCSTEPCVAGCVLTQGYWKNHPCEWPAPFVPGANGTAVAGQCALTPNPNEQCACDAAHTILIGSIPYTQCQLLCSLAQPGGGNAVRILAHQLIAAKLNVLSGATPPSCGDGDALIGSLNILTGSVAPSSTLGQQMLAIAVCLDLYNNGDGGVTHCP